MCAPWVAQLRRERADALLAFFLLATAIAERHTYRTLAVVIAASESRTDADASE